MEGSYPPVYPLSPILITMMQKPLVDGTYLSVRSFALHNHAVSMIIYLGWTIVAWLMCLTQFVTIYFVTVQQFLRYSFVYLCVTGQFLTRKFITDQLACLFWLVLLASYITDKFVTD